jgi:hypothetical protein
MEASGGIGQNRGRLSPKIQPHLTNKSVLKKTSKYTQCNLLRLSETSLYFSQAGKTLSLALFGRFNILIK